MSKPIPIGICVSPDKAAEVAPGYDYLELAVSSALVPLESEEAYAPREALLQDLRPPVRAFNLFVPGQVKLVGDQVDWDQVELYVERALRRAAALGGEVIVFGSGGARSMPKGCSRAMAWGQLVRFLGICADEAAKQGPTIAIEPLNSRESNIINTYTEGVQLARDVARDEVRVLADIYHFVTDAEPLDDILEAPEWLAHVHLADTGRRYPGSGVYPLERLFEILKEIGYQGRASVECGWGDDYKGETKKALAFLRGLAE